MSFEDFLFLGLVAILINGAVPLRPSWISDRCIILACFDQEVILLLQREEMSNIGFQDGSCDGHLGFSICSFSYFVSTRHPKAHPQVLIQLYIDYRDVQNMNSQYFPI